MGGFAEAASQLKLKVGGWVQVSLEFSVNDRKTQDGRDFKAQRVRIINISPLWGHEEPADKAFWTYEYTIYEYTLCAILKKRL